MKVKSCHIKSRKNLWVEFVCLLTIQLILGRLNGTTLGPRYALITNTIYGVLVLCTCFDPYIVFFDHKQSELLKNAVFVVLELVTWDINDKLSKTYFQFSRSTCAMV